MAALRDFAYSIFAAAAPGATPATATSPAPAPPAPAPGPTPTPYQLRKDTDPDPPAPTTSLETQQYRPSVPEVLAVKSILLRRQRSPLPLEVVDTIIDHAEYWPCTVTKTKGIIRAQGSSRDSENKLILRTLPLGFHDDRPDQDYTKYHDHATSPAPIQNEDPTATANLIERWLSDCEPRRKMCQKVVFRIKSHDQGWGGSRPGTFATSYTWFDVGLERVCAVKMPKAKAKQAAIDEGPKPAKIETSSTTGEVAMAPEETEEPSPTEPNTSLATLTIDRDSGSSLATTFPGLSYAPASEAEVSTAVTLISMKPLTVSNPSLTSDSPSEFVHALHSDDMCLQKNLTATRKSQENVIVWSADDDILAESKQGEELKALGRGKQTGNGEFVRNLRPGDVITVWAKARFPGWVNVVEEASVEVYWAV